MAERIEVKGAVEVVEYRQLDPHTDVTHHFTKLNDAIDKADEIGSSRFQAVTTNGEILAVDKQRNGQWQRQDGAAVAREPKDAAPGKTEATLSDEAENSLKARDLAASIAGETGERALGILQVEGSRAADEAIATRANQHLDAYLEAKRPALDAIAPEDVGARLDEMNRRDVEIVAVETAQQWARLDATDFRKIDDASMREDSALAMAANASGRYHQALREVAPDVADSVQAYADVANRHAIEARNYELMPVPKDELPQADASQLVREDLTAFRAIDNSMERRNASVALGDNAENQAQYKAELVKQDPRAAEVIASLYADSQTREFDNGPRKTGEAEVSDRFVQQLDERMAKSELEEKGWRDRTDLADVMRDLEVLAGKDWQRAANLWDKYRPDDKDKPIFIDGDDKDAPKPGEKAADTGNREARNNVDRERSPRDRDEGKEVITPETLRKRYLQAENKFYFRDDENKLAFEDMGKRLATDHSDPDVARSMVELAKAKGWNSIKLKGTDEFKREVWLQASSKGMDVQGYQPKDVDRAKLADMLKESDRTAERMAIKADKTQNAIELAPERAKAVNRGDRSGTAAPAAAVDRSAVINEQQRTLSDKQRQVLETIKDVMRARGDSDKAVNMAAEVAAERFQNNRVHVGNVVEHGAAPYENDPKNQSNYYVKLQTAKGQETVWGVDLQRAMKEGGANVGDEVALAYQGRQAVTVKVTDRDEKGKAIGTSEITTHRNAWDVNRLENVRDEVKVRLAEQARSTQERQPLVKVYDRDADRAEPRPEHVRVPQRANERVRG